MLRFGNNHMDHVHKSTILQHFFKQCKMSNRLLHNNNLRMCWQNSVTCTVFNIIASQMVLNTTNLCPKANPHARSIVCQRHGKDY